MADRINYQEHLPHDDTARKGKAHVVDQTGHSNKRKRDHEGASDNPRHGSFKRASPANNTARNGTDLSDPSGGSFLSTQNASGNGEDEMQSSSNSSHDFSALTQQLVQHAASHQNGGQHSASEAASTAAAALAGVFPQMTIPQPTEISFASNTSGGEGERQLDSSFGLGEHDGDQIHPGNQQYNLDALRQSTGAQVQAARETSNGGGVKPAVGSDEWHKVRRDNHKEGQCDTNFLSLSLILFTDCSSRAAAARNHQRRHQRTRQDRPRLRKEQRLHPRPRRPVHSETSRRRHVQHRQVDV